MRHHAFLRARLRGLGVAEANLDDAAQDVYEVLVRRIGDYDSRFSLRQWLAGVARKVARRHRERERRAPLPIDEGRMPTATLDPEHAAARGQGLAVLRRFLAGLDADRWAVFVLSEIEGLRGTEIAAELEVNLSTVYARLRTAKQAFETAAAAQHGPGRSWLRGLLVAPPSLFRRAGTAAFTTPLALGVLAITGFGLTLGTRACAAPEAEPEVARQRVEKAPTSAARRSRVPEAANLGIPGRAVDPARLVPASSGARGPVADAGGWFAAGSGFSEGPGAWSQRLFYKLEGADFMVRIDYSNDGDVPVQGLGWIEPDGLEIVEGPTKWPIDLALDEDRSMTWRLRAARAGIVRTAFTSSPNREDGGGSGSHGFALVNEGGALRTCRKRECDIRVDSIEEHGPGERITVELRNDCGRPIDVFAAPMHLDEPPPDAPRHYLATGERRTIEIDSTMKLMRRDEHGEFTGSVSTDAPGAVILFFGPDCAYSVVDAPPRG